MPDEKQTVVIYHDHCADGAAAAWVANQAFPGAAFHPMSYGDEPPHIPDESRVLILDFSLDRDVMIALSERLGYENVDLLDHHESAAHRLAGLYNCYFDMNRSGAMIAWDYLFSGLQPPSIIEYVQDRDLWRWELPHSREISAWIASWPNDPTFARWDIMADQIERDLGAVATQGQSILRAQDRLVDQASRTAVLTEIGGHEVPTVNSPVLASEIGERLLQLHPDAPFAAIRVQETAGERYSLRSRENGHNVAATAAQFGGGGHAAAAGFRIRPPAPEPEEDELELASREEPDRLAQ